MRWTHGRSLTRLTWRCRVLPWPSLRVVLLDRHRQGAGGVAGVPPRPSLRAVRQHADRHRRDGCCQGKPRPSLRVVGARLVADPQPWRLPGLRPGPRCAGSMSVATTGSPKAGRCRDRPGPRWADINAEQIEAAEYRRCRGSAWPCLRTVTALPPPSSPLVCGERQPLKIAYSVARPPVEQSAPWIRDGRGAPVRAE
jgi:hypothetical protein